MQTPDYVPSEYYPQIPQSEFCEDRYSLNYLQAFRKDIKQYCDDGSRSAFTCFHSQLTPTDRRDAFCIASNARIDREKQVFVLDCPIEDKTAVRNLPSYWYGTGPKAILDKFVHVGAADPHPVEDVPDTRTFIFLLKREGETNPWHCLMEIMSMTFTFDVLRMARNPTSSPEAPFFTSAEDSPNTQIVILDDRSDGPYFDLWKLFSGREPKRLSELSAEAEDSWLSDSKTTIILPLAGASNRIWDNDWVIRDCNENALLRTFVERVLAFYSIKHDSLSPASSSPSIIKVTLISRTGSRRLQDEDSLVDALRAELPAHVHLDVVDMAAKSFKEQLEIAHSTDVLIGVHGAGLTHLMFMREGKGAVVEIQPESLIYQGFRNLAAMRGQLYFSAHAAMSGMESRAEQSPVTDRDGVQRRSDWHNHDVVMSKDRFVDLAMAAVKALYNEGQWNYGVN